MNDKLTKDTHLYFYLHCRRNRQVRVIIFEDSIENGGMQRMKIGTDSMKGIGYAKIVKQKCLKFNSNSMQIGK